MLSTIFKNQIYYCLENLAKNYKSTIHSSELFYVILEF